MAYRVKEKSRIQSTVLGQLEEREYDAGVVEAKSEVDEALLGSLVETGHAEIVTDEPVVTDKKASA